MKLGRRALMWGGGALAAAAFLVYALRPAVVPVEVTAVTRGPLRVTIDEEGRTRVRDRYLVVAPVAGRVARMTLEEGAAVTPGMAVARLAAAPLDPRSREEAAARLRGAEDAAQAATAAASEARAGLAQAGRSRSRAESLFAQHLLSTEQREVAALAETTAIRQVEAADFHAQSAAHDVEVARAALTTGAAPVITLASPVRGRVLRIAERSERVVAAGTRSSSWATPAASRSWSTCYRRMPRR